MQQLTITINHAAGLHARPLAQFVKTVKLYDANVEVFNLTNEKGPASGLSPLKLMLLGVSQGHQIKITADGPQAEEAIQGLQELIESNFGEG